MKMHNDVVPHMCPKLRRMIIVDTLQTRKCLSCGFAVHRLVIKSHPYLKYALASNFVPLVFMILMVYFSDVTNWYILAMTLPMHVATFFAGRFLIAENSVSFYKTSLQELQNWMSRV